MGTVLLAVRQTSATLNGLAAFVRARFLLRRRLFGHVTIVSERASHDPLSGSMSSSTPQHDPRLRPRFSEISTTAALAVGENGSPQRFLRGDSCVQTPTPSTYATA